MPALILIAIAVVISAVAYNYFPRPTPPPSPSSPSSPASPTPSTFISPSPRPTSLPSIFPTVLPSPSATFVYPGAVSTAPGIYTSSDSPDKVTSWYQEQITSVGFNVRSFVKTSANGSVNNTLTAAKNSSRIWVEITRPAGQPSTVIKISLDNV